MIFGGFSGKFLNDAFIFEPHSKNVTQINKMSQAMFVYQCPTMYDHGIGRVVTIDWQSKTVFTLSTENGLRPLKKLN